MMNRQPLGGDRRRGGHFAPFVIQFFSRDSRSTFGKFAILMCSRNSRFGIFAKFAILALFAGCGGWLSSPSEGPGGTAGLAVTILWPDSAAVASGKQARPDGRLIPRLTESIGLALKDGATPLDSRLVPRPSSRIAFESYRDTTPWTGVEIYVMNSDGTNQTNVTNEPGDDYEPSWSPDGSKIVFHRATEGEIYVMNSDGTNQTNLTNNPATDRHASWSPDGSKIAFASDRDGNFEIYVMNADGSNPTRLTNNPADEWYSSWSPDGSKIAFDSNRDGDWEIYVMNWDGTNPLNVSNTGAGVWDNGPSWSPDGSKIAFTSNRTGADIYVMNSDGSNQTRLTNNPLQDASPSWSPDGSKIAYRSELDASNEEIYVMNSDGTNQTNLTNNPAVDYAPSWGRGASSTTVRFEGLAMGRTYTLEANAYPNADGTGNAMAGGSVQVVVPTVPDTYGSVTLTLASTVATVEVTPANPSVAVAGTIDFTATARDASSSVVLTPPFEWSESSSGTLATIDQNGHFTAIAEGSVTVTATETESSVTGQTTVLIGTWIAFTSYRDGNEEIYVMNPDGTGQTNLTNNPARDECAVWSSDGSKIAFCSTRDGD